MQISRHPRNVLDEGSTTAVMKLIWMQTEVEDKFYYHWD